MDDNSAGWRADPLNPNEMRWWDGTAWSDRTTANAPAAKSRTKRIVLFSTLGLLLFAVGGGATMWALSKQSMIEASRTVAPPSSSTSKPTSRATSDVATEPADGEEAAYAEDPKYSDSSAYVEQVYLMQGHGDNGPLVAVLRLTIDGDRIYGTRQYAQTDGYSVADVTRTVDGVMSGATFQLRQHADAQTGSHESYASGIFESNGVELNWPRGQGPGKVAILGVSRGDTPVRV
jgi:hypothetical protein